MRRTLSRPPPRWITASLAGLLLIVVATSTRAQSTSPSPDSAPTAIRATASLDSLTSVLRELRGGCPEPDRATNPTAQSLRAVPTARHDVDPSLLNAREFREALAERDSGPREQCAVKTVILSVSIDVQGTVTNAAVVQSSGDEQVDATVTSAMQAVARFSPATLEGVPVAVTIQIPVSLRGT